MSKNAEKMVARARAQIASTRSALGRSQGDLAQAIGISSPSGYSRLENGVTEMTLRQFIELCLSLDLDPAEVLRTDPAPKRMTELEQTVNRQRALLASINKALKSSKDAWDK